MSRRLTAAIAATGVLALAGCAGATQPDAGVVRADVPVREVSLTQADALPGVTAAGREIAAILLSAPDAAANAVVSPSSVQVALSMLSEGARAQTLADLEATLGATGESRRDAFAALRGQLAPLDGDPREATGDELPDRPIVHLADQVVIDDDIAVDDAFLDAVTEVYDAGIQYVDLSGQDGKKALDDWTDFHTGGLVPRSAIVPNENLRVVFQDAVLLAARWETPFDANATSPWPFTLGDGSDVEVDMMRARNTVAYAEVDGWSAARLPYLGGLHADVILPPAGADPSEVSGAVLAELDAALDAATPETVNLAMPIVDTATEVPLLDAFASLGIASATCDDPAVDLSGIALAPGDLCVAQAAQQAVLKIDEEGTVAAAVTEIGTAMTSAPPEQARELTLDRPYLFTVSHTDTDWMLFAAAIRDPRN